MPAEVWRGIKGFEDCYEVSSLGRVRSLPHSTVRYYNTGTRTLPVKGRILRQGLSRGRAYVDIKGKRKSVHRLVAEVFCGGFFEGAVVNHKDSNPLNNLPENLEWCTQKENIRHGVEFGKIKTGDKHGSSKISNLESDFIKYWRCKGYSQNLLASTFNLHQSQISRICNNKRRKNQYKETV